MNSEWFWDRKNCFCLLFATNINKIIKNLSFLNTSYVLLTE